MVIHNHKFDDKVKIIPSNCSASHTGIKNINYDNNNQDVLSLSSQ
jgi:hypothetical protein